MIASTARIIACSNLLPATSGLSEPSLPTVYAADSGSIATSGNSSSVPQRMHIASCSLTTLPQPGHCRADLVALGAVQQRGDAGRAPAGRREIKNQMKNEEPLILPTSPPARANEKARTR